MRTAYHEAGHAVLSACINDSPDLVSIRQNEGSLGRNRYRMTGRPEWRVQVHLAGRAAEELLCGKRPRQFAEDLGFALLFSTLSSSEPPPNIVGRDEHQAVQQILALGCSKDADAIRAEVERFYAAARDSLAAVWGAVEAVAKALLKHEELDHEGFDAAVGGHDLYGPVFAVQRKHGFLAREPTVMRVATRARSRSESTRS